MSAPLWLINLAVYSVQALVVVGAAGALAGVFRLRSPRAMLAYWQVALAACIALPWVQPWQRQVIPYVPNSAEVEEIAVSMGPAIPVWHFPTYQAIAALILLGAAARLGWLGLGLYRLRVYRKAAVRLDPVPEVIAELQAWLAPRADLLVSREAGGAVSFGFRRPVVLFPARFAELPEAYQAAIACHEMVHVRRRDWLITLFEELVRAALWFHPAVWWLLGRIQLAREQAVDREVVELTGARGRYVEALLEMANVRAAAPAVAPLFLRRRHFVRRLESIIKEASMSKVRIAGSLAGMSVLLVSSVVLTVSSLPLKAAPEYVPVFAAGSQAQAAQPAQRIRVGGNVQQSKLEFKVTPAYPPLAKQARIQGVVRLQATINKDGTVGELTVVSGHPMLIPAAMEAVRQWRYQKTLLNGEPVEVVTQIDVNFTLSEGGVPGGVVGGVIGGVPGGGPAMTPFGPRISEFFDLEENEKRIRVNSAVQKRKLIHSPDPEYPAKAAEAGIRGVVRLQILIGTSGEVKEVRVISGHPLLIPAAIEGVGKWRYRPSMLDGEPVEVITQVEVGMPPGEPIALEPYTTTALRIGLGPGGVTAPQILQKVEPKYSQEARDAKFEGTLVCEAEIDEQGLVRNVRMVRGLGLGLDQKAVEALQQWRFKPGEKDGRPVPVRAQIEINFRLK